MVTLRGVCKQWTGLLAGLDYILDWTRLLEQCTEHDAQKWCIYIVAWIGSLGPHHADVHALIQCTCMSTEHVHVMYIYLSSNYIQTLLAYVACSAAAVAQAGTAKLSIILYRWYLSAG